MIFCSKLWVYRGWLRTWLFLGWVGNDLYLQNFWWNGTVGHPVMICDPSGTALFRIHVNFFWVVFRRTPGISAWIRINRGTARKGNRGLLYYVSSTMGQMSPKHAKVVWIPQNSPPIEQYYPRLLDTLMDTFPGESYHTHISSTTTGAAWFSGSFSVRKVARAAV